MVGPCHVAGHQPVLPLEFFATMSSIRPDHASSHGRVGA